MTAARLENKLNSLEKRVLLNDIKAITKLAEILSDGILVRRNNKRVEALLKQGTKLRDPYLTWCLADATYHGVGVIKSIDKGLVLYKRAARFGVADAWTAMGVHFFELGTTKSRLTAIKYYKKAAAFSEPHAIHNLGVIYSTGIGLKQNLNKAYNQFLLAAKLGNTESQFKVGWCLLHGEGTPINKGSAIRWLKKATSAGNAEAKSLLQSLNPKNL